MDFHYFSFISFIIRLSKLYKSTNENKNIKYGQNRNSNNNNNDNKFFFFFFFLKFWLHFLFHLSFGWARAKFLFPGQMYTEALISLFLSFFDVFFLFVLSFTNHVTEILVLVDEIYQKYWLMKKTRPYLVKINDVHNSFAIFGSHNMTLLNWKINPTVLPKMKWQYETTKRQKRSRRKKKKKWKHPV